MYNKQGENKPPAQIFKSMITTNYKNNYVKTQLSRVCTEEGESIEEMLRRLTANKEPIPQNVPPIYTPYEEGVIADYDIRADRFDIAYQATDKYAASKTARAAEIAIEGVEEQQEGGETE